MRHIFYLLNFPYKLLSTKATFSQTLPFRILLLCHLPSHPLLHSTLMCRVATHHHPNHYCHFSPNPPPSCLTITIAPPPNLPLSGHPTLTVASPWTLLCCHELPTSLFLLHCHPPFAAIACPPPTPLPLPWSPNPTFATSPSLVASPLLLHYCVAAPISSLHCRTFTGCTTLYRI